MSTTVEKRRTSPAKRVEILQRELARRQEKLEAVSAEIAELKAGRQEAVTAMLRSDPTKSAFQRGQPPWEGDRKIVELEKTAGHLEDEIVSLQSELTAAAGELAERHLGEATLRAKALLEEERDIIGRSAALLPSLIKLWNARVGLLEDRRRLSESVRAGNLLETVAASDLVAAYEEAAAATLAPQATSFAAFLNALVDAAFADRVDVAAEFEAVDELNRRRAEQARKDPGGGTDLPPIPKPVIRVDPLHQLVPDLRHEARTFDPTIAGAPMTLGRTDEGEIEGLRQSGFGLSGVLYTTDGNARLPWRRSPGGEAA